MQSIIIKKYKKEEEVLLLVILINMSIFFIIINHYFYKLFNLLDPKQHPSLNQCDHLIRTPFQGTSRHSK